MSQFTDKQKKGLALCAVLLIGLLIFSSLTSNDKAAKVATIKVSPSSEVDTGSSDSDLKDDINFSVDLPDEYEKLINDYFINDFSITDLDVVAGTRFKNGDYKGEAIFYCVSPNDDSTYYEIAPEKAGGISTITEDISSPVTGCDYETVQKMEESEEASGSLDKIIESEEKEDEE